jgi:hypothetical protein
MSIRVVSSRSSVLAAVVIVVVRSTFLFEGEFEGEGMTHISIAMRSEMKLPDSRQTTAESESMIMATRSEERRPETPCSGALASMKVSTVGGSGQCPESF